MNDNDRNTLRKRNEIKKKRFYTAIYGGVGALALVAVVLAVSSQTGDSLKITKKESSNATAKLETQISPVSGSKDATIPTDLANGDIGSSIIFGGDSELGKKDDVKNETQKKTDEKEIPIEKVVPSVETKKEDKAIETEKPIDSSSDPTTIIIPLDAEEVAEDEDVNEETAEVEAPVNNLFTAFDSTQKMNWPILGEVVMDFSTDKLVYDKTLEQYRTNEIICIAAPVGSPVKAAAEGIIKGISTSSEYGKTVIIDHGNGWVTTYSQLQDNVSVKLGDVVKKEQVIGGVNSPTRYSVLLGSHVGFEVTKDDSVMNPHLLVSK